MPLRKSKVSKASKATKAKEAVTDPLKNQVTDRTDDLMAALEAAKEALARASRKGAELGTELSKEASRAADKAADKLMPERAKQRRRAAARRRNLRVLAGAAGLAALGVVGSRLSGSKAGKDKGKGGWDRVPDPAPAGDPAASAEVTQLHTNGAGGDPARTPPS